MADTPSEAAAPPEIAPLDVDGVRALGAGTLVWVVALILCLAFRGPLADAGNGWWTWVCLAGTLLGAAGFLFARRRREAYRRAAAARTSEA